MSRRGPRPYVTAGVGIALALLAACRPPDTPVPPGAATLHEIVNVVLVRAAPDVPFDPAGEGDVLPVGGQAQTGPESHVRLSFGAGSVVRLGSSTSLTLGNFGAARQGIRLQFEGGRIWVSLFGTPLEAQTPIGLITVEGSFAELRYQPGESTTLGDDLLILKCLEGACALRNESVDLALGNLEQAILSDGGQAVLRSLLPDEAVAEFLSDNPGSVAIIASLTAAPTRTIAPPPTDTPRPPTPTIELRNLLLTAQASASATLSPTPTNTRVTPRSPFPGATSPGVTSTPGGQPQPSNTPAQTQPVVCIPPEFYDPLLNRCRLPDAPATNTQPPPPPPPTNTPIPPPTNTPEPPTITPNPTNTPGPTKTPEG